MPWRFRRSVRIAPGVRLNFGKKGASLSVGGHGVTTTYGPTGTYTTVSIPGTGLSYRQRVGNGYLSSQQSRQATAQQTQSKRQLSFQCRLEQDGSVTYFDENNAVASSAAVTEIRRQNRAAILQWLGEHAREFNAPPAELGTLHYTTPLPVDTMAWSPPPFPQPKPQPPVYVEPPVLLAPFLETPNWLAQHLPLLRKRVERRNQERMAAYRRQLDAAEQAKEQAAQDYAAEELAWESKLAAWETALAAYDADTMERRQLLTAPRPGDESALQDFLWQRIRAIPQPRTIKLAVDVQPGALVVGLCLEAPNEDDPAAPWPALVANVNATRLRIYFGQKTKRQMHIEFLTYLASLSFRLIGEVFASLPAADVVTLDASSTNLVPGKVKRELRVRVERSDWAKIDFTKLKELDASAWLASYRY